jgi:cytochrome c peroxidase
MTNPTHAAFFAATGIAALVGCVTELESGRAGLADEARPSMGSADAAVLACAPTTLPEVKLGRAIFFDTSLSSPAGMACATCHDPGAGWTHPDAKVNATFGPVPGVVAGRFGNRKPPTASYAALLPKGPPHYDAAVTAYVGGLFWDGRASDLAAQAAAPFVNPNEMNDVAHGMAAPGLVVAAVKRAAYADDFQSVYRAAGEADVFARPTDELYGLVTRAIAAFESSCELSPFSSKYDAYLAGTTTLSDQELEGLRLVTGSETGRPGGPPHAKAAQCVLCHGIPEAREGGPDLWTNTCYANIGVPKNKTNPFYGQIDRAANPLGFNPAGDAFVDLGLGGAFYPTKGLPPGNMGTGSDGTGDNLSINGTFKAPTLRNVDKRPRPDFVKSYMHNGVFKSLEEVVHFYNTRNLTDRGEVIDFTKADPYAGLAGKPLWPAPEVTSTATLQNPSGAPGSATAQVGNLALTSDDEAAIVAFLKTLSDGWSPGPDQK